MRLCSVLLVLVAATTVQAVPPRRLAPRQETSAAPAETTEAPAETPSAPAEIPVEPSTPASEPPTETPTESPSETPSDTPSQIPSETPSETPTPVDPSSVSPDPQPTDETPTPSMSLDPTPTSEQPVTSSSSPPDLTCADECEGINGFADEMGSACGGQGSAWCVGLCESGGIKLCRDCVNANAANLQVQEQYGEEISRLWEQYQVPYCEVTRTKFGNCPVCDNVTATLDSLSNCDTKEACQPGCTEDVFNQLSQCQACAQESATDEGIVEIDYWLNTWRIQVCTEDTTTPDCGAQCETIGAAMNESCTDGRVACHGLCPNKEAAQTCWDCQNKVDQRYAYPQMALGFYCNSWCGETCAWVADTYSKQCMDLTNSSDCVLCHGADARPSLDRCNECVPNSRLFPEQKATVMSSLAQVYSMCTTDPEPPTPKGCEEECSGILQTYYDSCKDQNADTCKGMCTASRPSDLDKCSACAHGNESIYSDATRDMITDNSVNVTKWCLTIVVVKPNQPPKTGDPPKTIDPPKTVKPPGSVEVPNPREVKDVVDKETRNPPPRNTTSPRPKQNPFGNSTAPVNTKNSSSGGGGIPTWGIGVAAAGSVLVVAGAAAAIVANNFECDHDHRRLRRKKKNKKKKNNDMPAPEWHQEPEKPQVVGYMLPTQEYTAVPTHEPPTGQYPQQYAQAPYGQSAPYPQGGRY